MVVQSSSAVIPDESRQEIMYNSPHSTALFYKYGGEELKNMEGKNLMEAILRTSVDDQVWTVLVLTS